MSFGAAQAIELVYSIHLVAQYHLVTFGHKGNLAEALEVMHDAAATAELTGTAKLYAQSGNLILEHKYFHGVWI